ncbi:uncharacterized protein TRIVIDRAFT_48943 [Trichoderma virens Gv29-8]|uniref:F-box domain-containing protein n=1 Tax=Hypocrea virens (strain Gv29-8 / FGSC 10586) TaxID=413071 RepID=G9MYF1_HYPVG|nr:uncharacterized protein TRIVIDRAFT_48943 [Trichoderma virens Gv29-8]EHK20573.1 hypothetical protein TRIVIDRAFT_48943 [Trichoderma virens Gv29-8]
MSPPSLPKELWDEIATHLPGRDVKNLRLVCKSLSNIPLPLDRVFISANLKDIEVFRCVADHDVYRHGVREIIWDEARFQQDDPMDESNGLERTERGHIDDNPPDDFINECQKEHLVTTYESWWFYREYLRQQREVLAHDSDIKAFEYGLQRFTALQRITLTPAAHGLTFTPLYRTPMIRTLPYGLNYKLPRGWPSTEDCGTLEASQWNTEADKAPWRGFREVIRNLAEKKGPYVTELVLDVHQLLTGLTCRFFDKPCKEFDHLIAVLRRPGFRRLDLSLMVGAQSYYGWESFRNGRMRHALAEASSDLEHIHLRTDILKNEDGRGQPGSGGHAEHFVPLRSIFPIECWPNLKHFGLSKFFVQQDDIIAFLSVLPKTIRVIELSFLYFLDGGGNYRDLLDEMRSTLGWQSRDIAERPKIIIGIEPSCSVIGRAIWLEEDLELFMYHGGPNPFKAKLSPNVLLQGHGGTERDEFQPDHERPWVDHAALVQLGIQKESQW